MTYSWSKFEPVWKLMSEYTLDIDPGSANVDLTCGICKKMMIDACQTVCGCQYCYQCLSVFLKDGDKYCPGNKEDCNEEKLVLEKNAIRNSILNKRIFAVKVRCPNVPCASNIVLAQLEDHLRVCTKQQTSCPYATIGCDNEGMSRDDIESHLQIETFTHSQLLIELIHNLKNEVEGLKEKFRTSQTEISSLREELTSKDLQIKGIILQIDDQKREMSARIEKQNGELQCLKDGQDKKAHIEEQRLEIIGRMEKINGELIVEMKQQKQEIEDVKKNLKIKENALTILKEELMQENENAKNEMQLILTAIIKKKEKIKEVNSRPIAVVRNEMRVGSENLDEEIERRMDTGFIENQIHQRFDVDFVWRIDEFSRKMDMMKESRFYSDSFRKNDYKLCLYANIDGDNIGLYCMIMQGDNDDRLQWPMRLSVTVGITNQVTLATHASGTTECETNKYDKRAFDRPKKEMNNWGIRMDPFLKYSSIKGNKSLIVENAVIVTCVLR